MHWPLWDCLSGKSVSRGSPSGGQWTENRQKEPDDLRGGPIADHNHPGHCYAGMLAPLKGLSIKGAIFHQGYNNAFDGSPGVEMYRDIFPQMIEAWRDTFDDPKLPFGILSLCTDGYPQTRDNYCEKMFNAGIDSSCFCVQLTQLWKHVVGMSWLKR